MRWLALVLVAVLAGCGNSPSPSGSASALPSSTPVVGSATPTPTPTNPDLVVGTEALIAGVPRPDDGWRVLVDSVAHGSAAMAGGQSTLPKLPEGQEWLRLRFRVRYVGTGTPSQRLLAQDMSVLFQSGGNNYEAKPFGASPALETDIAKDADVAVTFWFSIAESAPVVTLTWGAFGQPPLTYQWDLTARSPRPTSTAALPSMAVLLPGVKFPPTAWGTPWRTVGGKLDPEDPWKAIQGLHPPDGVYVLDWVITGIPCSGLLDNGFDSWSFDATRPLSSSGLVLADLADAVENPYQVFTTGCDGWAVALRPVKTYFGPNSVQVARLILRAQDLGSDWELVAREEVSPNALAIEALVLDAAKRDPDLGAALHNALAEVWEIGNRYLADNPNAATLRRLAITAEVAQPLLPAREFDILYGPMADYVDPLDLGLHVRG